jgi:hypothetical protein
MTRHPDKSRETRIRNMARRQGLVLEKSRRRDPAALDYGRYNLVDPGDDPAEAFVVTGVGDQDRYYSATLDEIETYLRSGAWSQKRARARGHVANRPGVGV